MNHTQGQNPSFDRRRPLVIDAPDWFNRARARANQRQTFQPRPVPLPAIAFAPGNAVARIWLLHKSDLLRVLPLVALPIVFGIGFWARGSMGPAGETANVGERESVPAVALTRGPNEIAQKSVAAVLRAEPAVNNAAPEGIEVAAVDENQAAQGLPLPASDGSDAGMQAGTNLHPQRPPEAALAQNRIHPGRDQNAAHLLPAQPAAEPADGFSLKSAGLVKQVSAEVVLPASAWFDTAAAQGAACTTGTCPAPVARLDRKLNTALEWSSTPQAAAELAARDGKLVFLIHVSGNFLLPGFT